jgi:hypothetical protein
MAKQKAHPLPIDFRSNAWDQKVKRLKKAGFTHALIAKETGLTIGQVDGRVQKGGLGMSLKFRHGKTPDAKNILQRFNKLIGDVEQMRREMKKFFKERKKRKR